MTTLAEKSFQAWISTTDRLGRESQGAFLEFVASINGQTENVRQSLEAAARAWIVVADNSTSIVRDPLKKVLDQVGDDLRKAVRDLDALIAQRYPMAVRDVTALTESLQGLVGSVGEAQGRLDLWLKSLEEGRAALEQAHRDLKSEFSPREQSSEIIKLLGDIREALDPRRLSEASFTNSRRNPVKQRKPISPRGARPQRILTWFGKVLRGRQR